MLLDHVRVNVRDYEASKAFYEPALRPLGYQCLLAFDEGKAAGFRNTDKPQFWVSQREPFGTGTHVAFARTDRATVDAFHAAALTAGGIDNGEPGLRQHHHPGYHGAFVLDPASNNVEAVCHSPA